MSKEDEAHQSSPGFELQHGYHNRNGLRSTLLHSVMTARKKQIRVTRKKVCLSFRVITDCERPGAALQRLHRSSAGRGALDTRD